MWMTVLKAYCRVWSKNFGGSDVNLISSARGR